MGLHHRGDPARTDPTAGLRYQSSQARRRPFIRGSGLHRWRGGRGVAGRVHNTNALYRPDLGGPLRPAREGSGTADATPKATSRLVAGREPSSLKRSRKIAIHHAPKGTSVRMVCNGTPVVSPRMNPLTRRRAMRRGAKGSALLTTASKGFAASRAPRSGV